MVCLMWYLEYIFCYLWAVCSLNTKKQGFDFMGVTVISEVEGLVFIYQLEDCM